MTTNEPTATIFSVSEEVQKAFQASDLISELGHFAGETQYLLAIHEELNSEPKESLGGNDSPEASGWRVLTKQPESDPFIGADLINSNKNFEGIQTDYIFTPIYRIKSYCNQDGVPNSKVIGASYMIDQGDEHDEYWKSLELSYLFDEDDPNVVGISVDTSRYNTRNLSFWLNVDLRTGELLGYDGTRWGKNLPSEEASIQQLFHTFKQFQDKWLPLEK